MTLGTTNAFAQAKMKKCKVGEREMMKFRGIFVEILCKIAPEACKGYVAHENGKKIACANMLKLLCGMLKAALLHHKKFVSDIAKLGCKVNPYGLCIMNKHVNKKKRTLDWHANDAKASCVDSTVNRKFGMQCKKQYGSDELGHAKMAQGKTHEHIGMVLDCNKKRKLKVDVKDCMAFLVN